MNWLRESFGRPIGRRHARRYPLSPLVHGDRGLVTPARPTSPPEGPFPSHRLRHPLSLSLSLSSDRPNPPTHTLMPEKCTAIFYFFNTLLVSLFLASRHGAKLPLSHSLALLSPALSLFLPLPHIRAPSLSPCHPSPLLPPMRDVAPRSVRSVGRSVGARPLGFFRSIDNLFG